MALPQNPAPRAGTPDLTGLAAAGFVRQHGHGALLILRERAETAEELGHKLAARTWREMADAASDILGVDPIEAPLPLPAAPIWSPRHYDC